MPPAERIRRLVDDAFEILRDPKLASDRAARMTQLRAAADKVFDWAAMAQSSLGHHWRKLDAGQRSRFVEVFKELLARRYMEDLDRFRGTEAVQIIGTLQREELRIVQTILVTDSRERIPMDYALYLAEGRWLVNDLSIEGISLVLHYRKSFDRFLVNKSFAELLEQLERRLGRS
jgi:phospholipid transport system substrate-binding protein